MTPRGSEVRIEHSIVIGIINRIILLIRSRKGWKNGEVKLTAYCSPNVAPPLFASVLKPVLIINYVGFK